MPVLIGCPLWTCETHQGTPSLFLSPCCDNRDISQMVSPDCDRRQEAGWRHHMLLEIGAEPPDAEDVGQEGVPEDGPPQDARVSVVGDH